VTEELKIYITAQIDELKSELNKGKKEVKDFEEKSKHSFEEYNEAAQKAGDISKNVMKTVGVAIAGAATALLALAASTKEYRENQAKLNTAFEAAGATANEAKNTYNELYRVLGDDDRAVEAANHLAKLTTNQKDLSSWTNICQGIYATFGDSLPIEGLTEAANETARVGAVTGPLADALNWAGVSEDAFNEKLLKCATTQEREALIRETLNGLYSEAAAGYEKNAKDILKQNEAQIKLNEATGKLGAAIAPIQAQLTELAATIAEKLAPQIQTFMDEHGEKIKTTLENIATAIGKVINWVVDNWDLVSTIGTIILAIAAALSVFSTVMGIVNAVMLASPVTWIVLGIIAALAALIAIIVIVIKHWDDIKAAVSKAVDKIKETIQNMVDSVKQKIENFKAAFSVGFDFIKNTMRDKINAAKDTVLGIFDRIKSGITDKINNLKNTVKNIIDTIKGFFNFEFKLPKIKTPSFGISPSGWKLSDLLEGVIPKLSIKWNAQGGVFDKPTIVPYGNTLQGLGEAGAEAIVPLEKNTEWLDKIADKLSARQGNTPIVLQVDGKTFAETSINTINALTRQTGSLKLNLV
jgi:hypothetical protein